jgi:NADH-quinone oxidoreductase subunit K
MLRKRVEKGRPPSEFFLRRKSRSVWYLLLSAALFALGILGFLIKRNLITVFMSIELMLNAVNLSFVTFAHQWHAVKGQIFVFFVMMVAAAEAAVGLAIIIAVFRARATLAVDRIDLMKL